MTENILLELLTGNEAISFGELKFSKLTFKLLVIYIGYHHLVLL